VNTRSGVHGAARSRLSPEDFQILGGLINRVCATDHRLAAASRGPDRDTRLAAAEAAADTARQAVNAFLGQLLMAWYEEQAVTP
jgi:hypothetical protein